MDFLDLLQAYRPVCEQEHRAKEQMILALSLLGEGAFARHPLMHLTASALVVNGRRDRTLMVYHHIYQSFTWPGGHADGERDLLALAMRETCEETGLLPDNLCPLEQEIASLDTLTVQEHIKRGKVVSAHLHLNAAFLLQADENAPLHIKADENADVRWLPIDQIQSFSSEKHMWPIYRKLIARL